MDWNFSYASRIAIFYFYSFSYRSLHFAFNYAVSIEEF